MLVGICGIQDYLVKEHDFQRLSIEPPRIINDQSALPETHDSTNTPPFKSFATVEALLDFATENWQTNFVTTSIHTTATATILSHRPFFLLLHIDAPLSIRYDRRCAFYTSPSGTPTLSSFVAASETHLYTPPSSPLALLASKAHLQLLNTSPSLPALHASLSKLNVLDPARLRPNWDTYFMTLASLAARRSNCMRRQVGCVLIRANRVISTGYNGTPRHLLNCLSGGCPRCNTTPSSAGGTSLSTCLCLHAEENALLEAGRERVGEGSVLYCDTCPCLTCSIKIVQVGISEVVFAKGYYMDAAAERVFKEGGVKLRRFEAVVGGLVVLGGEEVVMEGKVNGVNGTLAA
ncbi:Deoxycytidine monophosphate (dCMP) deaminase [Oleoguttula sp. CCFEE 5521]